MRKACSIQVLTSGQLQGLYFSWAFLHARCMSRMMFYALHVTQHLIGVPPMVPRGS